MTSLAAARLARSSSQSAPAPVLVPGHNLGPWTLVRFLGRGAFSQVWSARPSDAPHHTPADYALKIVDASHEHAQLTLALLQREAAAARLVSHPHLVAVLGAEFDGEHPYLVLPFLRGVTLRAVLDSGLKMPLPHLLWLARQAAQALAALHAAGLRHGDFKPDNLLVAPNGHLTLFDLGFAQPLHAHSPLEHGLFGSPRYLAPELLHGSAPCNGLADSYALGVTLFEMLAGQPPFAHGDPVSMAMAHLQETPPDIQQHVMHLPPRLVRLLKRLLAKQPLRRPTAEEAAASLAELEIDTLAERAAA